jgi:hypothetical protein
VAELDEATRSDAHAMLNEVARWRVSPDKWEYVAKLVDALAVGVSGNDADAVRNAVDDLDLVSPLRIPGISKSAKDLPPEKLRERVNRLIHTLDSPAGTTPPAPAEPKK